MDYQTFKEKVGVLCGINLSYYKSQQMDRRINSLMQAWGITEYGEYLHVLETDHEKFREFVNKLTINVSEFFRNPERFIELWEKVIPEMLKKYSQIKIWSAGCSDGSEPYSISIIVSELRARDRVKIVATDIDREILAKAKEGIYGANDLRSLPVHLQEKYFEKNGSNFILKDEIKRMVEFRHHNLLHDPYETNVHLIVCRNVVIYFTEEAKNNIYTKFYQSLVPGGYLLVGGTEPILQYRQLGFEHALTSFYKKP